MFKLLVLPTLLINTAFARLTYSHLVYVCKNDDNVEFHVLRRGPNDVQDGKVIAYNKGSWQDFGPWCGWGFLKSKETKNNIKLHERTYIGEEPSACDFKLNKKRLTATIVHKQWDGYVSMGSPKEENIAKLKCEVRDEIVEY